MFEEIEKVKKDLPKFKTIEKEVGKYQFNGYQKFAMITYLACFVFGIILGNLFPTCNNFSLYSNVCVVKEFNFFLTVMFWFASFLLCLFFFALGHIISLLSDISKKLGK